jgi:hypothetical protein
VRDRATSGERPWPAWRNWGNRAPRVRIPKRRGSGRSPGTRRNCGSAPTRRGTSCRDTQAKAGQNVSGGTQNPQLGSQQTAPGGHRRFPQGVGAPPWPPIPACPAASDPPVPVAPPAPVEPPASWPPPPGPPPLACELPPAPPPPVSVSTFPPQAVKKRHTAKVEERRRNMMHSPWALPAEYTRSTQRCPGARAHGLRARCRICAAPRAGRRSAADSTWHET